MKTIVFVCVALVVLVASEARPSASEEGSPPATAAASGGRGLSQATSLGVGKYVGTHSETGAKDGISYGASDASADTGIVMSQSQSQYEY